MRTSLRLLLAVVVSILGCAVFTSSAAAAFSTTNLYVQDKTGRKTKMSASQRHVANTLIARAYRADAPYRATLALVEAGIVETMMTNKLTPSEDGYGSYGVLQARVGVSAGPFGRPITFQQATSVPMIADQFLHGPAFTSWNHQGTPLGAIRASQMFGTMSAGSIAQKIEGSGYPRAYDAVEGVARQVIAAWYTTTSTGGRVRIRPEGTTISQNGVTRPAWMRHTTNATTRLVTVNGRTTARVPLAAAPAVQRAVVAANNLVGRHRTNGQWISGPRASASRAARSSGLVSVVSGLIKLLKDTHAQKLGISVKRNDNVVEMPIAGVRLRYTSARGVHWAP